MVICLTSAAYNMKADILRQGDDNPETPEYDGTWVTRQDPDSGEIVREWQPNDKTVGGDNSSSVLEDFKCIARGFLNSGLRGAGTTERFSELYEGVDYVSMKYSPSVKISKRDRITNIRDLKGNIIWVEEERSDLAPTIFNVAGVVPVIDAFGKHIENVALLERAEDQ